MDLSELAMTALRGIAIYAIVLLIIRLSGKRTIGNFSAFDLLVALMLGEVVDEIIYGEVTFLQGLVALVVIASAHFVNAWLSYFGGDKVLEGKPTVIVKDGAMQLKGMRKERMNADDVWAELRLNGIADIREVKLAMVENDGQVSVLRHDWAEPLQKRDLPRSGSRRVTRKLRPPQLPSQNQPGTPEETSGNRGE